jgi:hypothetical protein
MPGPEFSVGKQGERHRAGGIERGGFGQQRFRARKISRSNRHPRQIDVRGSKVIVDADRFPQRALRARLVAETRIRHSKIVVRAGIGGIDRNRFVELLNRCGEILARERLAGFDKLFVGTRRNSEIGHGDKRTHRQTVGSIRIAAPLHPDLEIRRPRGRRMNAARVGVDEALARHVQRVASRRNVGELDDAAIVRGSIGDGAGLAHQRDMRRGVTDSIHEVDLHAHLPHRNPVVELRRGRTQQQKEDNRHALHNTSRDAVRGQFVACHRKQRGLVTTRHVRRTVRKTDSAELPILHQTL